MSKIEYVPKQFQSGSLSVIATANAICAEYAAQGYDLTLRQLYYQFVARGIIANRDTEYKRLGSLVNDGRLAGLIDWSYIVDRTRNLAGLSHWTNPASIINSAYRSFRLDKWEDQPNYVEVWVEKEALAGVVERVANELDVSFFSCRGYVSQSEMHSAALRFYEAQSTHYCHILHLGDHDPSGIDMTRDIQARLALFGAEVCVKRIALNYSQVEQYNPPPNPAKLTDSRCVGYVDRFGEESWELDALDPATLHALITDEVLDLRNQDLWDARQAREDTHKSQLRAASERWPEVAAFLG